MDRRHRATLACLFVAFLCCKPIPNQQGKLSVVSLEGNPPPSWSIGRSGDLLGAVDTDADGVDEVLLGGGGVVLTRADGSLDVLVEPDHHALVVSAQWLPAGAGAGHLLVLRDQETSADLRRYSCTVGRPSNCRDAGPVSDIAEIDLVVPVDLDEDGLSDLILVSGDDIVVSLNEGSEAEPDWSMTQPFGTARRRWDHSVPAVAGDIDHDGHVDVVALDADLGATAYYGDGRGSWDHQTSFGDPDRRLESVALVSFEPMQTHLVLSGDANTLYAVGLGRTIAESRDPLVPVLGLGSFVVGNFDPSPGREAMLIDWEEAEAEVIGLDDELRWTSDLVEVPALNDDRVFGTDFLAADIDGDSQDELVVLTNLDLGGCGGV